MLLIKAAKFIICTYREVSVLSNNTELKADGYLSEYNFQHYPIWVCDTLINLYICNNNVHTRKSKILNFFEKFTFDEKADTVMHPKSMQPAMCLKLT